MTIFRENSDTSSERAYGAILLDLDGTLVDDHGSVHERNVEALRAASEGGTVVMVATGRSLMATLEVLDVLELPTPAVVFNGAAIYCPKTGRMLEERLLSKRILTQAHDLLERTEDLSVIMCARNKYARAPRCAEEERALSGLKKVETVSVQALSEIENVLRVTFLSQRHEESRSLSEELEREVVGPSYRTHFPLSVLPRYKGSPFNVADLHAPCQGKAEALRYIEETHGITADRVVAVGDANNDIPMVEAAGLGVAMANAVAGLQRRADRVIGDNHGTAIAELVEELFL
jgi:Cof subfamily protein (haloacid dehalogenase superfamily)